MSCSIPVLPDILPERTTLLHTERRRQLLNNGYPYSKVSTIQANFKSQCFMKFQGPKNHRVFPVLVSGLRLVDKPRSLGITDFCFLFLSSLSQYFPLSLDSRLSVGFALSFSLYNFFLSHSSIFFLQFPLYLWGNFHSLGFTINSRLFSVVLFSLPR